MVNFFEDSISVELLLITGSPLKCVLQLYLHVGIQEVQGWQHQMFSSYSFD